MLVKVLILSPSPSSSSSSSSSSYYYYYYFIFLWGGAQISCSEIKRRKQHFKFILNFANYKVGGNVKQKEKVLAIENL